ncbi:MAG: twin-arginine translocase TatA/TatE family subunit [Luteitalea sp.]|nr:twin-arginine translocase TatA/TatE family subunit [Luteitalea sp.]
MLGPLGMPELIIIFVVALIVFGPRKLPELGRSLGRGLSEFKRASNDLRNSLEEEIRLEDERDARTRTEKPAASTSEAAGPRPVEGSTPRTEEPSPRNETLDA